MDALSLLCNLHADGPFTLQRLRRSGCDSMAGLLELAPVQLATHLDGSERTAQRFLREAELLAERLEDENPWERGPSVEVEVGEAALEEPVLEEPVHEEPLDEVFEEDELDADELEEEAESDEAYGYDEDEDDEVEACEDGDSEEYEEDEDCEEDEDEDEDETEYAAEDEVILDEAAGKEIDHVLGVWRQTDHDAPPEDPVDYIVPRPAPPVAANQALDELHLDGLDIALRERLGEVGILSLKGLVEASPLDLTRRLPLPFTRVKHIQFLARRVWDERSEPLQAPRSYDELVEVERLDASGPFAGEPGHWPD